jgi:hypothetical protein
MSGNIEKLKRGELTADELDLVSGGGSTSSPDNAGQTNNLSLGRGRVITNGGFNRNTALAR